MPQIKEQLKVVSESAIIAGEESGLAIKNFFSSMPNWQKWTFFICLILILPGYFATYYGVHAYVASQHRGEIMTAHAAFADAKSIQTGKISILKPAENQYAVFFQATNPNLDLVTASVPYTLDFYNAANQKIASYNGTFFLLADQQKYIIVPRVDSREEINSAKLSLGEIKWQKRLSVPKVSFKTPTPQLYNQGEEGGQQLVAEGSVINDSPYTISKIQIGYILYNQSGQVIAVSQRQEGNLLAFGRRAYKQFWPNIAAADVSKVEVFVDVDTLNPANLDYQPTQSVPASDLPELRN